MPDHDDLTNDKKIAVKVFGTNGPLFSFSVGKHAPTFQHTFVTIEGFIMNTMGYEHPGGRAFAFLKYIPAEFQELFRVEMLDRTWQFGDKKLFRAESIPGAEE